LYGAVGFGIGTVLKQFNEKRIAERELAIWDYVQRHPEDFPELRKS
jgi:NADH-ubiquinone oxidoreductase subunit b14.5b (NDUFC2)